MKKILLITLLALAGCTSSQLPNDAFYSNKGIEEEKIRTKGHMNGYSIKANDLIEGRTKGANYKRLLISDGENEVMTRYAYDCGKSKHSDCYAIHIWDPENIDNLYSQLKEMYCTNGIYQGSVWSSIFPSYWDKYNSERNEYHCNKLHISCLAVTLLDKKEANVYLKEHPETKILKA